MRACACVLCNAPLSDRFCIVCRATAAGEKAALKHKHEVQLLLELLQRSKSELESCVASLSRTQAAGTHQGYFCSAAPSQQHRLSVPFSPHSSPNTSPSLSPVRSPIRVARVRPWYQGGGGAGKVSPYTSPNSSPPRTASGDVIEDIMTISPPLIRQANPHSTIHDVIEGSDTEGGGGGGGGAKVVEKGNNGGGGGSTVAATQQPRGPRSGPLNLRKLSHPAPIPSTGGQESSKDGGGGGGQMAARQQESSRAGTSRHKGPAKTRRSKAFGLNDK